MKVLADEYLNSGKMITGVIPQFLKDKQIFQNGLTRNIEVKTMAERKQKLEELSDAFITIPGGFGIRHKMVEEKFLKTGYRDYIHVSTDPKELQLV